EMTDIAVSGRQEGEEKPRGFRQTDATPVNDRKTTLTGFSSLRKAWTGEVARAPVAGARRRRPGLQRTSAVATSAPRARLGLAEHLDQSGGGAQEPPVAAGRADELGAERQPALAREQRQRERRQTGQGP